jgi:hypothetical protein
MKTEDKENKERMVLKPVSKELVSKHTETGTETPNCIVICSL